MSAVPLRPRARFWLLFTPIAAFFVLQGWSLARRMVTWGDENAYVHLGYLFVTGRVSLFDDVFPGHRMPLPFYLIGWSQRLFGADLLAARMVSLAIGLVALVLVAVIARRAAGEVAGLLAPLFLATQGVIVGYFATALYHSLTNAILLAGLALVTCAGGAAGRVAGMAVFASLFFTRTNLFPVIPGVLGALLVLARSWRERLWLVTVTTVPVAAFFLSDTSHLKLLAYVPGLERLVAPLGYQPIAALLVRPPEPPERQLLAFALMARRFEFWVLAFVLLAAAIGLVRRTGRDVRAVFGNPIANATAALLVYTYVWQFVIHRARFKEVMGYFPSFAALVPVVLGIGFALVLTRVDASPRARAVMLVLLVPLLVGPSVFIRHPLLPSGKDARVAPLPALRRAAAHMATVLPREAHVFLFGHSMPLYLADRHPYLRQIHDPDMISVSADERGIQRNGLWGVRQIDAWLGRDADYAVVMPALLETYRETRGAAVERIEALLAQHFERVAQVDEYPWWTYDLYRRRTAMAP